MQRSALTAVSFGKVGFQRNAGVGILQRIVRITFFQVGGRSIAVVHVIGSIEIYRLGVILDCLGSVAGLQSGVSFCFKLRNSDFQQK